METGLEALRRNDVVCGALRGALVVSEALDATLASQAEGASSAAGARSICVVPEDGPQAAAVELCSLLQLCLPKGATPLIRPALCAILNSMPQECGSAGVMAVSRLKEDWIEVVCNQALRSLERRLDSLNYELQKTPPASCLRERSHFDSPADGNSARVTLARRRASRDAVIVLTALCEVIATAQAHAEERCKRSNSALSDLGSSMEESATKEGTTRGANDRRVVDEKTIQARQALLLRRAAVVAELHKLSVRVRELDVELGALDEQLGPTDCSMQSSSSSTRVPSSSPSDMTIAASDCSEPCTISQESSGSLHALPSTASHTTLTTSLLTSTAQVAPQGICGQLQQLSEAVSGELQRHVERLRSHLKQRRLQLLLSLVSHLDYETLHLPFTVPETTEARASVLRDREAIEAARDRAQELGHRVETALSGVYIMPVVPKVRARCRAKWMDGKHYDAEVQGVMDNGTILLNWLRPRPDLAKPLVTVSERGGDDTLHRIVLREDINLVGTGSLADPPREVLEVQRFFESRSRDDQVCADCTGESSEWASISFGIYLCTACAALHRELGPRRSLVRPLNDGWCWSLLDLAPLRLGGNIAFKTCLEGYAEVSGIALQQRYMCRFAEHYRRHLDALSAGLQAPPPLPQEGAALPFSSDFLSVSEAAAAAHTSSQRFLAAADAALARLPTSNPTTARRHMAQKQSSAGLLRAMSSPLTESTGLWGQGL